MRSSISAVERFRACFERIPVKTLGIIIISVLLGPLAVGTATNQAQAAYTVTLEQVGPNVVATGSGTIDLTGLSFQAYSCCAPPEIQPDVGYILTGPAVLGGFDIYTGVVGPTSFGSGSASGPANSGNGDYVAIEGGGLDRLFVPAGYVSEAPLSDTSTYDGVTFASLGVTPGTYVWSWGGCGFVAAVCVLADDTDDSFTLKIGGSSSIPEPSGVLLFGLPLGLVMLRAEKRRRANG
jgi:hypothetical protein